ncbi:hypothetical protein HDE_03297 [Halotydeus destructor]|nr:hypothetical protein HDE_03297 [Halotydeus destructor]
MPGSILLPDELYFMPLTRPAIGTKYVQTSSSSCLFVVKRKKLPRPLAVPVMLRPWTDSECQMPRRLPAVRTCSSQLENDDGSKGIDVFSELTRREFRNVKQNARNVEHSKTSRRQAIYSSSPGGLSSRCDRVRKVQPTWPTKSSVSSDEPDNGRRAQPKVVGRQWRTRKVQSGHVRLQIQIRNSLPQGHDTLADCAQNYLATELFAYVARVMQ